MYPQAQQGAQETEQMARVMLANQFAASMRQEIKVKVAGVDRTFAKLRTHWSQQYEEVNRL